jgi:hypothetical protein
MFAAARRHRMAAMPLFVLHHTHDASDCETAFAAWNGFDSPLRHRPVASTCLAGGHCLLWRVRAPSLEAAVAMLPAFVAARTEAVEVREVEIP